MMLCDYCGKETRVDSYEVGGSVDCGKCRPKRNKNEVVSVGVYEKLLRENMNLKKEIKSLEVMLTKQRGDKPCVQ
jgi:hypothetical protein